MSVRTIIKGGLRRAAVLPRKVLYRIRRPALVRLDPIEARLDRLEAAKADLYRKCDGLASHLTGLSGDHRALAARFESRVMQLHALSNSVGGINGRLTGIDEALRAFQALHWDHVALTRRLAAIEDLLAATSSDARATLEEGAARPLLPFPGLADSA